MKHNSVQKIVLVLSLLVCLLSPVIFSTNLFANSSSKNTVIPWAKDNHVCMECHDGRKRIDVVDTGIYSEPGDERQLKAIYPEQYGVGIHANMLCTDCHASITSPEPPHQVGEAKKINCVECHKKLLEDFKVGKLHTSHLKRLHVVAQNTENYLVSYHARDNKDDDRFANAWCDDCHDSHFFNIPTAKDSPTYMSWRYGIPDKCGGCHDYALETYVNSVHGVELLDKNNFDSANCTDCHPAYMKGGAHWTVFKVGSQDSCGSCHPKNLESYRNTYHGQVTKLGYTHTAKCFDCHESHKTLPVDNPKSLVHENNLLKTCQKCHDGKKRPLATKGFTTYSPHAHDGDFKRYPQVWIASWFMYSLLSLVTIFFLVHSILWFYREWQDKQKKIVAKSVDWTALGLSPTQHIQRYTGEWRLFHGLFSFAVIMMITTGMSLKFSHTTWAPLIAKLFGGVEYMGLVHRYVAAFMFVLFVSHLFILLKRLLRDPDFRWFGPDSLLPTWRDFVHCWQMFVWFFNRGEKPKFDRWPYYTKFGYWAIYWGIVVIGVSGLILAFPTIAGQYLEGWVFNVSLLVHSVEALLATFYLFVFHVFHNNFRPSKVLHQEAVIFSGSQSLEVFQREHPAQFDRLVANGKLQQLFITEPSPEMLKKISLKRMLLIAAGFLVLALVLNGVLTS
ncbi:MAG: cytochrome b/b6 domain-containing protein [Magnetococcales bacterium]|nr:cytochrome b/b6 domain-containing protein [Magnetococcales bacterium]